MCILEGDHRVLFSPHLGGRGPGNGTFLRKLSWNSQRSALCQVLPPWSCPWYRLSTPTLWRAHVRNVLPRPPCPINVSNSSAPEMCLLSSKSVIFSSYHSGLVGIYAIFCIITQSALLDLPFRMECPSFGHWECLSRLLHSFGKAHHGLHACV